MLLKDHDKFGPRIKSVAKQKVERFYTLFNVQSEAGNPTFYDFWILIKN